MLPALDAELAVAKERMVLLLAAAQSEAKDWGGMSGVHLDAPKVHVRVRGLRRASHNRGLPSAAPVIFK